MIIRIYLPGPSQNYQKLYISLILRTRCGLDPCESSDMNLSGTLNLHFPAHNLMEAPFQHSSDTKASVSAIRPVIDTNV